MSSSDGAVEAEPASEPAADEIRFDFSRWPEHIQKFQKFFNVNTKKFLAIVDRVEREGALTLFFSSPFDGCEIERSYFMARYYSQLVKLLTA